MTNSTVLLQQVDRTTLSYVETLLGNNDLPSTDVRSKPECFYVGYDGDDPVGIGGIEIYGADGLLRSVVVEKSLRGRGYGVALCDVLETRAQSDGVETLYLLTTTAPEFFADCGYVEIDRGDAPTAIRETTEFEDLCPASATCMKKDL